MIFLHLATTFLLGFYLIINLQWYDYKISRVVLKHHKPLWHILYFIVPFLAYYMLEQHFWLFFIFAYIPMFSLWYTKLDKKLVFTARVKRYFAVLLFISLLLDLLFATRGVIVAYSLVLPLLLTYVITTTIEKFLFTLYKKEAKKRLSSIKDLEIVAITGSYGKTSIKNFVASILATKYRVYATPRSINTIGGIIKDVNESLPIDTQIYVCEAGARQRGDIRVISEFLEPQRVVVGRVGLAHIEYFKTLHNIIATKLEIMFSPKLKKAYIHSSVTNEPHEMVEFFGGDVYDVQSTLDGLDFKMNIDNQEVVFHSELLGSFQTMNLEVAIKIARDFGFSGDELKRAVAKIKPVEHRLQKIIAGGKIILDDGYNGNIDGMLEAIRLSSTHSGDKVIVTPGLVESSDELNLKLIEAINLVFDTVIVTGKLNQELFAKHLSVKNRIILEDKSKLQDLLAKETKSGDLILFANDAPNFI